MSPVPPGSCTTGFWGISRMRTVTESDTLPRLALTHIALKPNKLEKLVFSQLYDALASPNDWPENKGRKKKKKKARLVQIRQRKKNCFS